MALQHITNGITGAAAADIIYQNDLENSNRIDALEAAALPVKLSPNPPNLFDPTDPYMAGAGNEKAIDGAGNIVSGLVGYKLSYPIAVEENTTYTISEIPSGDAYGIQFQNSAGGKISAALPDTFPYNFTTPAGTAKLQFTCKNPADADIVPAYLRLAGATSTIIEATSGNLIKADLLADNTTIRGGKVTNENDVIELIKGAGRGINLFNPAGANIAGYAVDGNGNIAAFAGYVLSYKIEVEPVSVYQMDCEIEPTNVKGVQFQDAAGAKIGYVIAPADYPFNFTTPSGCVTLQFTCKNPDEPAIPPMYLGRASNGTKYPFEGADMVAYGDSITVDYPKYADWLKTNLKVANVIRRGASGQSFTGVLQADATIAGMTAALAGPNVKLLVIHSVNDFRTNAVIGTKNDVAGTASVFGGLKKIINAAINANPTVNIILCTPLVSGGMAGTPSYPAYNEPNTLGLYGPDYADAIRFIASLYGGRLCDLSARCQFRPSVETGPNKVFTIDSVHPNDAGYDRMTSLIAEEANAINT